MGHAFVENEQIYIKHAFRIRCDECGRTVVRPIPDDGIESAELLMAKSGDYVEQYCNSCAETHDHKVLAIGNYTDGTDGTDAAAAKDAPVTA